MSMVPGDPASLSACAGTARSVAGRLGERAAGVRTTSGLLGEGWAGRTSVGVRRRAAGLADAADATAAELDTLGRVLQDHATDLADLVARARALEERARAAGLVVRDGRVEIGWGVTGTADVQAAERARRPARACRPTSTSCSRSTVAAATGCSGCCATPRRRCPTSRTGCAVDERIAGPTTERTPGCD